MATKNKKLLKATQLRYKLRHLDERRAKDREHSRRYQQRQRDAIYLLLGSTCKRCGFSDKRALQIDHIKGGGLKDRKRLGGGWSKFYKDVVLNPSKYQILCANCNWIKRSEEKEHGGGTWKGKHRR